MICTSTRKCRAAASEISLLCTLASLLVVGAPPRIIGARRSPGMSSRPGGGLQDLLDHAAREYQEAGWESAGVRHHGGHDVVKSKSKHGGALERTHSELHTSSWASGSGEQSADLIAMSNRSRELGSRDTATPQPVSRKRQRVLSPVDRSSHGAAQPSRLGVNDNCCSEDGVSAGESCGEDAEAAAEREGPGTIALPCLLGSLPVLYVEYRRRPVLHKIFLTGTWYCRYSLRNTPQQYELRHSSSS